jgi:hypothetical protein
VTYPKLAFGYSQPSLLNSFPAPGSNSDIGVLIDDFTTGSISTTIWDLAVTNLLVRAESALANVKMAYSTDTGDWDTGQPYGKTSGMMAHSMNSAANVGGYQVNLFNPATSLTIADSGASGTNGTIRAFCRFLFMRVDASNFYELRIVGTDMDTAKLYKCVAGVYTLLATAVGVAKPAGATAWKVTRSPAGLFTILQDGGSITTVTDTAITTIASLYVYLQGGASSGTAKATECYAVWGPLNGLYALASGSKVISYNNDIYIAYQTNASAFTITQILTRSTVNNTPGVFHINAQDIRVIARDTSGSGSPSTILYAVCGNQLRMIGPGQTTISTTTLGMYGNCIVPVNKSKILVAGTYGIVNSGVPAFEMVTFTVASNSVASQKTFYGDVDQSATAYSSGVMVNSYAFDSSGVLHLCFTDQGNTNGTKPSRMYRFTSADLLEANSGTPTPVISTIETVPNFKVRGLFSLAGVVYFYGAILDGTTAYPCVMKYPGQQVYRSSKAVPLVGATDAVLYNYGIMAHFVGQNGVLLVSVNDMGGFDPVLEMQNDGTFKEVAAFQNKAQSYSQPNPLGVGEYGGKFYLFRPLDNAIDRTGDTRGSFPHTYDYLMLQLSEMGANTPLVSKTLYAVKVELSTAIPIGETWYVFVNDTQVGTITNADGATKQIVLTSEMTASSFRPVIKAPYNSTWQGQLQRFNLQYVPTQLKKKAFSVGIRATRNLRMLDGRPEPRLATTMIADLWTAWSTNTPITFIDVDKTSYTVIITDIDEREPVIDGQKGVLEALIFLEMLEV